MSQLQDQPPLQTPCPPHPFPGALSEKKVGDRLVPSLLPHPGPAQDAKGRSIDLILAACPRLLDLEQ